MSLNVISQPPANGKKPTYLLVMLHGWGANAQDLAPLAPMLGLSEYECLFPDAPLPHPQVFGGKMWYDLESSNYEGLATSRARLQEWLLSLEKSKGVSLSRTFLSGFSQGGAMTLDVGLQLPLAGLCSLSGYLHFAPARRGEGFPPVFICHGRKDSVVPLQAAQKARDELTGLGVDVKYHEFEMGHEIQPAELALMREFIVARQSG